MQNQKSYQFDAYPIGTDVSLILPDPRDASRWTIMDGRVTQLVAKVNKDDDVYATYTVNLGGREVSASQWNVFDSPGRARIVLETWGFRTAFRYKGGTRYLASAVGMTTDSRGFGTPIGEWTRN